MKSKKFTGSILLYVVLWTLWSLLYLADFWRESAGWIALFSGVLLKGVVWLSMPTAIFAKGKIAWDIEPKNFIQRKFPAFAFVVFLCISTAFLHTIRLINGLQNTYVRWDDSFILLSLAAGVIEETAFRGFFFNIHEPVMGVWRAAAVNGVLFALYHYPELLLGQFHSMLSLRTVFLFCMGVVFCLMFHQWRNLTFNMAAHTCWNIISYLFCLVG